MRGEADDRLAAGDLREAGRLRLWLQLLKLTRSVGNELRECLRLEFDVTLPQFDVLAALFRAEKGLKMSALSDELMVSNGNVTGIVERLVAQGLVVRVPLADDRRAMLVRLTTRGREAFRAMAETHRAWVAQALGGLSDAEAAELGGLIGKARRGRP